MVKREDGGVHYAMNIIMLLTVCFTLYFLTARTKYLLVKEALANGLQICENYILADSSVDVFQTALERDRGKRHIISAVSAFDDGSKDLLDSEGKGLGRGAERQVRELTAHLLAQLKKQFSLNDSYVPEGNLLANTGTGKLLLEELDFYEGVYQTGGSRPDYFVRYRVSLADNAVISVGFTYFPAGSPPSLRGKELQGSTIYAKISYTLYGPKDFGNNLFGTWVSGTVKIYQDSTADVVIRQ